MKKVDDFTKLLGVVVDWAMIFSEISGTDYLILLDIYNKKEEDRTPQEKQKLFEAYNKVILMPANSPRPLLPYIGIVSSEIVRQGLNAEVFLDKDKKENTIEHKSYFFHIYSYGKRSAVYLENLKCSLITSETVEFLDKNEITIIERSSIRNVPEFIEPTYWEERFNFDIEVRKMESFKIERGSIETIDWQGKFEKI